MPNVSESKVHVRFQEVIKGFYRNVIDLMRIVETEKARAETAYQSLLDTAEWEDWSEVKARLKEAEKLEAEGRALLERAALSHYEEDGIKTVIPGALSIAVYTRVGWEEAAVIAWCIANNRQDLLSTNKRFKEQAEKGLLIGAPVETRLIRGIVVRASNIE